MDSKMSIPTTISSSTEINPAIHSTFSSNILPILDHLSQLFLPFQFLEFIQIILCLIQFFEVSFWVPGTDFWKDSKISNTFHYIAFFSSVHPNHSEHVILFLVFFCIILLISGVFLILVLHYNKTRRINKPLLYILRMYFFFIGAAILHPIASMVGNLINSVIGEHSTRDIFLLVFLTLTYFVALALFSLNQFFVSRSIYIHKSSWISFDSSVFTFLFIGNPTFLILTHLFQYYPKWTRYFLIIFHIILLVLLIINYLWVPFLLDIGNSLALSIIFSLIFNDIFRMAVIGHPSIKPKEFILISYLVFVVFMIISFIVIKIIRNKIDKALSHSYLTSLKKNNDNMTLYENTSEDKNEYFMELKLDENIDRAIIYLIIGFTSSSDMFIDSSLIQFCLDNYHENPKMLTLLIHLLSYFKSENSKFEAALKQYHFCRDSSYYGNFIFIQAQKVKMFRQVITSNYSINRLNNLKLQTFNLENQVKSFWSLPSANLNMLDQLEQQQRNLNNFWDESIEDNWSSIKFREEHIRFLIESRTDFQRAVKMSSIKDKIDILRKDRDDLCFLSLLITFPRYLKLNVFDSEGNFVSRRKPNSSYSSSGSDHSRFSTSSKDETITLDDQIANSIISFGKLRLSMQNALNYVSPLMSKVFVLYSIFSIVVAMVLMLATFSVYINLFDSYDDWTQEVGVLIDLRIAYDKAFLCLTILFGQETKRFSLSPINCSIKDEFNYMFTDPNTKFGDLALEYINQSKVRFSDLMEAVLQLSLKRVDTTTLTNLFYILPINSTFCYSGYFSSNKTFSMEQALNFHIMSFKCLADDILNIPNWYLNSTFWCHDLLTIPNVEDRFTMIQDALSDDLSLSSNDSINRIKIEMISLAPLYFVIFILPLPIIMIFYYREINHLIRIMLLTDQEFKDQARKNISLSLISENNEIVPPITKNKISWKYVIFMIFLIIIFCLFVLFEELILLYAKNTYLNMRNFGYFTCYFSLLRSYLIEIIKEIMNSVFFSYYPSGYLPTYDFRKRIYEILKNLEHIYYEVINDTPNSPSSLGVDSLVDYYITSSFCDRRSFISNIHDTYECASLTQLISAIHSMVEKVIELSKYNNGFFIGEELTNVYHLIFAHSKNLIREISSRFESLQSEEISSYKLNITVFLICGLIVIILCTVLIYFINLYFIRIFDTAISLIRRLSPAGLISNSDLTNYLLYKKGEEIEMGVTHTIFNNSFDGIICMNMDGIVEIINKSFAVDYGYSTEQLVGQLIGSIFDSESREQLENQLKLIKNHESPGYSHEAICYTNDGRAVSSFITLFAAKGNENSLILVIRDETILRSKKKKLELAKKKSQDLLEQIMPPKVLNMLKEGKSEISFSVPSASVLFVDIVNFSGFSADLSPQQIMGTLSALFGAFDTWIQKYPLMTKIKLIGDIYMAACGLFTKDDEPYLHAKQCIEFALHALSILDDINIKLNISLQIRMGVNTDGPLIAGVLGTENRVFDIIGDTINVASRLEHRADPGHILVSEKTYELVKDVGFNIVPVGEVFLKGKGNMPAFSIC